MKNRFSIILVLSIAFLGLTFSCTKKSNPGKVERIITEDTWKIQRFVDDGINIQDSFATDYFQFIEGGVLNVPNRPESGSWNLPSTKNPAVLDINLGVNSSLAYLSDDWNVVFITKSEFHLERKDGKKNDADLLYFIKRF